MKEEVIIINTTTEEKAIESKPFKPASFLDQSLQVTDEEYAVSYVKKSYDSAEDNDERAGCEHEFIIIQKPNSFYRAEIKGRVEKLIVNGQEITRIKDYIVDDTRIAFVDEEFFQEAQQQIIWRNDAREHPSEHLYH